MTARVLVVGIDAGDGDVAMELAAKGRLPHLASLAASGATVWFEQPRGASYIGAIWPTIATGCRPERHRYVSWAAIDPASYSIIQFDSDRIACAPFWVQLAEQSQRVAVIDVPRFSASRALGDEGMELYEWGTHDHLVGAHSWPPRHLIEAEDRFDRPDLGQPRGDHPAHFAPCDWVHGGPAGPRSPEQVLALREAILSSVDSKVEVSSHFLEHGEWDLFVTVACEAHCAGHQFWSDHVDDPAVDPADLPDTLVDVYERLDAGLGRLVEQAGPGATVVVLFSHGMTENVERAEMLDVVLDRIARPEPGRQRRSGITIAKTAWGSLPWQLRRRLHPAVARAVRRATRGRELAGDRPIADRADRPYATVPGPGAVTGIRLNQLGREARGLVPFDARQATLKRLSEHVLDLVDVETGRSAVRGVVRADDLAGNFADDGLADLLVEWDDHGRGHAMYSPALGLIPGSITTARSGDHREGGGLMVVRGTGITSQQLSGVAPEDLAPTIAALCGVSLTGIDGQPVDALLSRHAPASVSTPR